MNDKKFRVWRNDANQFEYFELHNITVPERLLVQHKYPVQQFIGILDKNMKEIYEEDVVKFQNGSNEKIGVVRYFNSYCSYVVEVDDGYDLLSDILFDSLEIVGNMMEGYYYDDNGNLAKHENTNS